MSAPNTMVAAGNVRFSNALPLSLIAGPCQMESYDHTMMMAESLTSMTERLGIGLVYKSSFDKANRTSLNGKRGLGLDKSLKVFDEVKRTFGCPVISDVHTEAQCAEAGEVLDILQIPAFLCRQTDLLIAAAKTGKVVNIKKGQFLSPGAMRFPLEKVRATGNDQVWLCERGVSFGYNDLIVDATSISRMKVHGVPFVMDCTHSVQKPNQTSGITGGDPGLIETIALSAIATGADGLFLEVHPDPQSAKSDPHTMLQLDRLAPILEKCVKVRQALYPTRSETDD